MEFQQYTTSSPASSSFSQSTDQSSPEGNHSAGETKPFAGNHFPGNMMQTVPGHFYGNTPNMDTKPFPNGMTLNGQHRSAPPPSTFPRVHDQPGPSHSQASSLGARTDKLPRQLALDQLPILSPPVSDLYRPDGPSNGMVKLQGDPQVIEKQRVETAIRAIIDFTHYVSTGIIPPPSDPNILAILPHGPDGSLLTHLARTGTFKTLRLQAGTTTKQISKKQEQLKEQARKGLKDSSQPDTSALYLETAVYKSDGHTRVYACSKCRGREAKRRHSKETSRKNPSSAEHKVKPEPSIPGGGDEDGAGYDPLRGGRVVAEPSWNPAVADWRHEIIIFNHSPEVSIKDGAVESLPFRVICYGKCHAEKTGFRIKFTVRTYDGRIYGTDMTGPIRITDDHKTDKAKPGVPVSRTAARSRKGTSVMSSQRTSPTHSDESQAVSEIGAMTSKQIPPNRGKPYDRPGVHRHNSSSSIHSVASMSAMSGNGMSDVPPGSAEWPNVSNFQSHPMLSNVNLRRPFPGTMTAMNGYDSMSYTSSNPPSVHSSAVQSPMSLGLALGDDLQANELAMRLSDFPSFSQHDQGQQPFPNNSTSPMLFDGMVGLDHNNFGSTDAFSNYNINNLQQQLSQHNGSYTDSHLSGRSGLGLYESSVYSENGPGQSSIDDQSERDMMSYLITDDDPHSADAIIQPFSSPPVAMPKVDQPPLAVAPTLPAPTILQVIPSTGALSGGISIAILGMNIPNGACVMFGGRLATTTACQSSYISCLLPPGSAPGQVEVTIQGYGSSNPPATFIYEAPTKEAIKLALQVQSQQPAAPNGPEMDFSPQSKQNGNTNGHTDHAWKVPTDTMSTATSESHDLQATLTEFLAALNEHSPGSLRHFGAINTRNEAKQTLIHLATILGYERLLRRLVIYGAQLDVQDVNGFTPLAFAAYCGKIDCARVLIEAGATYDFPTHLGEFPLDLAKVGGNPQIEKLLLSAVWSTRSPAGSQARNSPLFLPEVSGDDESSSQSNDIEESDIELDNDNPSDASEDEIDLYVDQAPPKRRRSKHKGKKPSLTVDDISSWRNTTQSIRRTPAATAPGTAVNSDSETRQRPAAIVPPSPSTIDTPPPYSPASWLDRFPLSTDHWRLNEKWGLADNWKIPAELVPQPIVSMFHPRTTLADPAGSGAWVTMPVPSPSWETLQKMTNPDDLKAFTQAMAAAAFNAVVQTGATTSEAEMHPHGMRSRWPTHRSSGSGSGSNLSMRAYGPNGQIKPAKKDRMFYLFWLPLLVFVGFWTLVTLLPIFTGFGLLYARSITRYVKQKI